LDVKAKKPGQVVVIAGDLTIDWNLARGSNELGLGAVWNAEDCTRAYCQAGGVAILAELIKTISRQLKRVELDFDIRTEVGGRDITHPGDPRFHHSYAMWKLFKYAEKCSSVELPAWRVAEFLGVDRSRQAFTYENGQPKKPNKESIADLVVLDDANLGFRDDPRLWAGVLNLTEKRPWILLKIAPPVAQGELWNHLLAHFTEQLIVVMTVNDLRLSEVQISRGLSWERTAQDLAWEFVYNPRINGLARCAHVVVSFDTAGAILFSRSATGGPPGCKLFFDPAVVEGMWAQRFPGQVMGYTSCLAAGLARQLMLGEKGNVETGVQSGLTAMRRLHLEGYGRRGSSVSDANLVFPFDTIATEVGREPTDFSTVTVEDPVRFVAGREGSSDQSRNNGYWTILQGRYTDTLDQVADKIVLEGVESVLEGVPLGQFGKLLTVDRREIEAFRSIRALISEYCSQRNPKRPLSIAVFGAPGAGKSFGIIEVANSLTLNAPVEKREFNLSQFGSPDEILDALHQVRDVVLSGGIPLVFWDEFDTALNQEPLGWLRYFLAPMQDGKFQQGQITHPIGRAIFVFAGGTSEKMEVFDRGAGDEDFKAVKGPDFVSRLKGFVDVLGPNPQLRSSDPYYLIRRAILLRSILARDARHLFGKTAGRDVLQIDTGVLRALLQTKRYKHGVRSMESIIAMSALAGKRRFDRSALPAEAQLELHVDAQDFLAQLQKMELQGEFLERLAEAAHDVFCDELRIRGYRPGIRNDDKSRTHTSLISYAELPESEKDQNRGNIRDIANKLALAGYVMMPARSNESPFDFPGADLEKLAEMEHERWMKLKLESGWRYAPKTNKQKKLHKALLSWRKLSAAERERLFAPYDGAVGEGVLPEAEKKKDYLLVRGIPKILSRAGYAVVKINQQNFLESAEKENRNDQNRSDGSSRVNKRRVPQRRNR
jgi:hypothetical protein